MAEKLPFLTGTFEGNGAWNDRQGKHGLYRSEFRIEEQDGIWSQVTRRDFLNDDGEIAYVENSTVSFRLDEEGFIIATITNDGNEYTGAGYVFGNCCHYDMDVSADNHLENTYFIEGDELRLLGSATNKGKYTVWEERLRKM